MLVSLRAQRAGVISTSPTPPLLAPRFDRRTGAILFPSLSPQGNMAISNHPLFHAAPNAAELRLIGAGPFTSTVRRAFLRSRALQTFAPRTVSSKKAKESSPDGVLFVKAVP